MGAKWIADQERPTHRKSHPTATSTAFQRSLQTGSPVPFGVWQADT
ncbi:hypothetical protein RISK_006090 [Rhodopirellula islandica]|uniref:Uncharacterized protein n=1 Tax=Rhodopirellula islandica TaxID=595434 RepID=A0A0J1B630_RHOIS|nr:hypothetical protein RISK_006090 [Rhodopirellula islandica]